MAQPPKTTLRLLKLSPLINLKIFYRSFLSSDANISHVGETPLIFPPFSERPFNYEMQQIDKK